MVKTYKNVGKVEVLELAPGESGERDISEAQEKRLIARGAIEVTTSPTPVTPSPEPVPSSSSTDDDKKGPKDPKEGK